jgi:hypothetical protein
MKKGPAEKPALFCYILSIATELILAVAASLATHHRRALSVSSGYVGLDAAGADAGPAVLRADAVRATDAPLKCSRHSEFLCCFTGGVALHIAQNKRGAQQR